MISIFGRKTVQLIANQMDDISRKMTTCKDANIRAIAEEIMGSLNGSASHKTRKALNKVEHLLDTVNTANGEYCTLYSEFFDARKFLSKSTKKSPKKIGKTKHAIYSTPRYTSFMSDSPEFSNIERFSSLKRYISKNQDDKKLVDYLYEQYYLKSIDDEAFIAFLRNIDNEFGIKLFADKPLKKSSQLYIYDELANFKKASSGKEKFPPIIDITDFDPVVLNYIGGGVCVKGKFLGCLQQGERVALRVSQYRGLRHELTHWFDSKRIKIKIFAKRTKITANEVAEMKNANVSNIDYAYTNKNEFKAVWGQGSMSKYSDEFKQKMIKMGLPEWITKLDDVSLNKYLDEIFVDEKSKKILKELKESFDGDIPEGIVSQIIDTPQNLEKYNTLLKYKNSQGRPLLEYGLESYLDIPKERLDYIKKFDDLKYIDEGGFESTMVGLWHHSENLTFEQMKKIYQKAQKCNNYEDYNRLHMIIDRYSHLKSNDKMRDLLNKAAQGKIKTNLSGFIQNAPLGKLNIEA